MKSVLLFYFRTSSAADSKSNQNTLIAQKPASANKKMAGCDDSFFKSVSRELLITAKYQTTLPIPIARSSNVFNGSSQTRPTDAISKTTNQGSSISTTTIP